MLTNSKKDHLVKLFTAQQILSLLRFTVLLRNIAVSKPVHRKPVAFKLSWVSAENKRDLVNKGVLPTYRERPFQG